MKLEENKKILIVACPRAATRFTYNLLNHFNINVGHEETKVDGAVSSLHLYTEEKFDYILLSIIVRSFLIILKLLLSQIS